MRRPAHGVDLAVATVPDEAEDFEVADGGPGRERVAQAGQRGRVIGKLFEKWWRLQRKI
jgi:hypothetical protein